MYKMIFVAILMAATMAGKVFAEARPENNPPRLDVHVFSVPESIAQLVRKVQGKKWNGPLTLFGDEELHTFLALVSSHPDSRVIHAPKVCLRRGESGINLIDNEATLECGGTKTFLTDLKVGTVNGISFLEPVNTPHFFGARLMMRMTDSDAKGIRLELKANFSRLREPLEVIPTQQSHPDLREIGGNAVKPVYICQPKIEQLVVEGGGRVAEGDSLVWMSEPYKLETRERFRTSVPSGMPVVREILNNLTSRPEVRCYLIVISPVRLEPQRNILDEAVLQFLVRRSTERQSNELENDKPFLALPPKPEKARINPAPDPNLAAAQDLYRLGDYRKAQRLFHRAAQNIANQSLEAEKARFFEAECQRMQNDFPGAMDTYKRLLHDYSFGIYREKSVARVYEIARYWLEDGLKQYEGKNRFNLHYYFRIDKTKPIINQEKRALRMLEEVYYHDSTGLYADKALFLVGYLSFHRREYRLADLFLTSLMELEERDGKPSPLKDQAKELIVVAKINNLGTVLPDDPQLIDAVKNAVQTSCPLAKPSISSPSTVASSAPSKAAVTPKPILTLEDGLEIGEDVGASVKDLMSLLAGLLQDQIHDENDRSRVRSQELSDEFEFLHALNTASYVACEGLQKTALLFSRLKDETRRFRVPLPVLPPR